jgi:predicted GIY-YIG superfamily endonuclease
VSGYSVYRLFDAEGNDLYVGVTMRLVDRLRDHSKKPWWQHVDLEKNVILEFDSLLEASDYEYDLIRSARPAYNRAGVTSPAIRYNPHVEAIFTVPQRRLVPRVGFVMPYEQAAGPAHNPVQKMLARRKPIEPMGNA